MRSELEKQGVDVYQVEVTGELQPQTTVGLGNDNINPLSYKIWQLYYVQQCRINIIGHRT